MSIYFSFFFFNDTAPTEIYTLSLHDALPIYRSRWDRGRLDEGRSLVETVLAQRRPGPYQLQAAIAACHADAAAAADTDWRRSEEHTSELQSRLHILCRLLLEKKKMKNIPSDNVYIFFFFFF